MFINEMDILEEQQLGESYEKKKVVVSNDENYGEEEDEEEEEDTKLSFRHKKVARAAKIGYPTKMWQAKALVTS